MKNTLSLLIVLIVSFNAYAQSWQWGRGAGVTPSESNSNAVATDMHGNVYIAGNYSGNGIAFGADTLYGTGYTIGDPFLFLVKYDASGNVLWVKNTGMWGNEPLSLATDAWGNVYMAGYFYNHQLAFGSDTLTCDTVTNQRMMFLVKYDGTGNVLWARTAPAAAGSWVAAGSVCTDPAGDVLVTGSFTSSQLIFGADTLTNVSGGDRDLFLAKYDASGNVLWARQTRMGISSSDCYSAISADAAGNVYLGGYFSGCGVYFGATYFTMTEGGPFLVKYNTDGLLQWVKSATGAYNYINAVNVDVNGNIIVAGTFWGDLTLGINTLREDSMATVSAVHEIFLAKYDSSGNVSWAKAINGFTTTQAMTTDGAGNIYIAGGFWPSNGNTLIIGSDTIIDTSGIEELLLAKYSSSGDVLWAMGTSGTANAYASGIAADTSGSSVYVTGEFYHGSLLFGSDNIICPSDYGAQENIFLAKLNTAAMGVYPITHGSTISLFPNPATTSLTVKSTNLPVGEIVITNAVGQTIGDIHSAGNSKLSLVNVSGLATGVYFIRVNGEVRAFVKE
jgi:hypothetical protein